MIHQLENTKFMPLAALHRALEDVDKTRAVIVMAMDEEGRWSVDITQMTMGELCLAEKALSILVTRKFEGLE